MRWPQNFQDGHFPWAQQCKQFYDHLTGRACLTNRPNAHFFETHLNSFVTAWVYRLWSKRQTPDHPYQIINPHQRFWNLAVLKKICRKHMNLLICFQSIGRRTFILQRCHNTRLNYLFIATAETCQQTARTFRYETRSQWSQHSFSQKRVQCSRSRATYCLKVNPVSKCFSFTQSLANCWRVGGTFTFKSTAISADIRGRS